MKEELENFFRECAETTHYMMFEMDKRVWLAFNAIQMIFILIMAIELPQASVLWVIVGFSGGMGTMATLATIRDQGGFVRRKRKNDEKVV